MERILLLIQNQEVGRLLPELLADDYELTLAQGPEDLAASFNLAILDAPALQGLGDALRARKEAAAGALPPVLLVTAGTDDPGELLALVDEVILAPLTPWELKLRVKNLLARGQLQGEPEAGRARPENGFAQKMAETLKETNSKFQALFEASPLAIISIDPDDRVMSWNPAAARIFGWHEDEVIGQPLPVILEERQEEFRAIRGRELGGEKSYFLEMEVKKRDGAAIFIDLATAPIHDAAGNVTGTIGLAADVSARKQEQEALQRANAEWERTFDAVPDLVAILDQDHRIVRANRAMTAALGLEPEQMLGRACYEVVHNLAEPPPFCPHSRVLAEGRECTVEVQELGRDFLVTTSPLTDHAGRPIGSVHLARDITEVKKAEKIQRRQAELLDLAYNAIFVWDLKSRLVFWNRASEELYGWSKEEAMGKVAHDLLKTEFPQSLEEIEQELLRHGRWEGELVHTARDGRKIVVASRWALHRGESGESARILEINTDITQRKVAEEMLKTQARVLESMAEGVIVTDPDGIIVHTNPAFDSMFGYAPGELLGKHASVLNSGAPAESARLAEHITQKLLAEGSWSGEVRNRKKDETEFITWANISELEMSGRRCFISVQADITARKEAEAALQQAHDDLEYRVEQRTAELEDVVAQLQQEVADRLLAEKALRESEERFQAFMRHLPGVATMRDARGKYVYANEMWERLVGKTRQDWLGKTVEEVWPGETGDRFKARDRQVIEGRQSFQTIEQYATTLGRVTFLGNWFPIQDQSGQAVMVGIVGIDVTARQQAEAALRESEERFRVLFQTAGNMSILFGPDRRILEFNVEAERITGWRRREVLGKDVVELLVPEEMRGITQAQIEQVLGGKLTRDFEIPIRVRDGTARTTLWNGNPLRDGAGDLIGVVAVGHDITPRKQAEDALAAERQRLFALLEGLPVHIYLRDAAYHLVFVNRCFRERFGDPRGRPCYEVLYGRHKPCRNCPSDLIFSDGQPQEREWRGRDGRDYQLYDHPFADIGGTPLVLQMGIDITDRKQAEKALKESEEKLRYLASQILTVQERERSRLSRELHEGLGQALLVLKLQMRAVERQLPEDWENLKGDCRQTLRYIDEIIADIRRLSQDLSPSVLENIGLAAAIKNLCDEFARLQDLEISLDLDNVARELSPEAQINIYRIFQEALANISKYARASRVALAIKKTAGGISFSIKDNGTGFPVAEVLSRGSRGRGLGLTTMEERVRMLGGSLRIMSAAGAGTTIAFSLPRKG